MRFEQLPNELLHNVFDYFNGVDLLLSFVDLNAHFRALLYQRMAFYSFDLYRMPKRHFDISCEHLLHRHDQVIGLKLFEHPPTRGVGIDLFFSHIPPLGRFTHLRSLSISGLRSSETKTKLLEQLPYLINLTHLSLQLHGSIDSRLLTTRVWNLPNLVHYNLRAFTERKVVLFGLSSVVSSSLQYLSIAGHTFQWHMLDQLFQSTPNLRSLALLVTFLDTDNHILSSSLPTLTKLTIKVIGLSFPLGFFSLLQNTPNLRYLDVDISFVLIDGHQWQEVICAYLPKLQTLKFAMESAYGVEEDYVEAFFDTFRSFFWTSQRLWFVRCQLHERQLHVQTVSKSSAVFYRSIPRLIKSTDPLDSLTKFYEQLTSIWDKTFFDRSFPADIHLPGLSNLSLKFPVNEQFWRVASNLEQLKYLSIYSYADQFASQLQAILDRTPRLHNLYLQQETSEPMDISRLLRTSIPIRHLNLHVRPLDEEECRLLSRSQLTKECQTLTLCVDNRENILILVNAMSTLHELCLLCEHIDEDLLQWLRNQLPPSCLISTSADNISGIHIWLP